MMRRYKKKLNMQIASQDGVVATELGLPRPVVYYPGFYGAFFGFSAADDDDVYFCSCAAVSIENYIRFKLNDTTQAQCAYPEKQFMLSSRYFPIRVVRELIDRGTPENESIIHALQFKDSICHECNALTPTYAYCVPMYGSVFEQYYGWYINKQSFEYGVMPTIFRILPELCPDEVFSDSSLAKQEFLDAYGEFGNTALLVAQAQDSAFGKQTRKMRNIIENEVRVKFGFKKIGDAWASETLLYQLVSEILSNEKVIRHYRASWLENLELDIFVPTRKLAIEYQGIQHFEPLDHWGGVAALERTRKRDKRKKALCDKQGVRLLYFYHTEILSHESVRSKIEDGY